MTSVFVDRKVELAGLDHWYERKRAGLMIVYGRRRVGKSRLLTHWMQASGLDVTRCYWMATTQSAAYQLRDFSQHLLTLSGLGAVPEGYVFPTWEAAFVHLGQLARQQPKEKPFLFVLDEFSYLVQNDPSIVSLLQRAWDTVLSQIPNLRLILSGSLISIMQRKVLGAQAPLYGRATAVQRLRALPFGALRELLPKFSADERVGVYALCGGIPAYLDLFVGAPSFTHALKHECLMPSSIMLNDALLMLSERLEDTQVYESVVASVASGFHEWGQIAKMSGVSETGLGHYLGVLEELEIVRRETPVLAPVSNRRGRYFVADPFLRFYYRFLLPQRMAIQQGDTQRLVQTLTQDLRGFIGTYIFEELAREWVRVRAARDQLGFLPEQVGSYWTRSKQGAVQLDVVAASRRDKRLLIGEAKWGEGLVARDVLVDLLARAPRMPEVVEAGWRTDYVLFARRGFTAAALAFAEEQHISLITLSDMEITLVSAIAQAK